MRYHKAQQPLPSAPVEKSSTPLLDSEGEKQQNTPKNLPNHSLTLLRVLFQLVTIVFVHQNPALRGWDTKYYIHLIVSRRIFLNIMKNFQLPAKYSLLKKSQGKICEIHLAFIKWSDWPKHGQNISFLHFMLWLHPYINKNLDANKKISLKINEHLSRGNKAIRTEQNEHWKQQCEIKPYNIQQLTKTKVFPFQVIILI